MSSDETGDALDVLKDQDRLVGELFASWRAATSALVDSDDVVIRSERGGDVKLLLQSLALREAATDAVEAGLRERHQEELADRLEGKGIERREAIDHLDVLIRGHQAMATNNADVTECLSELSPMIDGELAERSALVAEIEAALGPLEQRDLPSAHYVRTHSPTVPSPEPRWHDQVGPLKRARALYDHLRSTPSGGTKTALDSGRERSSKLSN
jgi:hypothetical protein